MKKIYLLVMMLVVMGLSGCAGISPTKVPAQITGTADFAYKLAKDGILYGLVYNSPANDDITTAKFACDAINNTDERCSHPEDYVVGKIKLQNLLYVILLMEKDKEIQPCANFAGNQCTYVKVKTEKGKLGTVDEIVSLPGEEKCKWSGGTVGGVICGKWDATKELRKFSTSNYALTGVSDK